MLHWVGFPRFANGCLLLVKSQTVESDKFQKFDYGTAGNLAHYNQSTPPLYSPQKLVYPPVALFTGK